MANTKNKTKSKGLRLRAGERRVLIVLGDFLMSTLALVIAIYVWGRAEARPTDIYVFIQQRLEPWFFLLPFTWLLLLADSYDSRRSDDL